MNIQIDEILCDSNDTDSPNLHKACMIISSALILLVARVNNCDSEYKIPKLIIEYLKEYDDKES